MRVLSLHPATTELLFAIGAGGMIVGRTEDCIFPESALKVPSIGPREEVSAVLVEVFEPELVLTGHGQRGLADELGADYKVVYFDPQSLASLYAGIAGLADLIGKQVEADLVIHDLRTLALRLEKRAAKYRKARVYCEAGHVPAIAATGYLDELLRLAGAETFAGKVTPERMQEFDPQMIISCVPGEETFNFDLLTARDGWEDLNALRYERLFELPGDLIHHPGPRLAEGIRKIARLVHGVEL